MYVSHALVADAIALPSDPRVRPLLAADLLLRRVDEEEGKARQGKAVAIA